MIYIVNDRRKVISCRSGNDDFLSACVNVRLSFCLGCVESCTLQNYVNTDLAPRKLFSISLRVNLDLFSANNDGILSCLNLVSQCILALCLVIFQ